VEKSKHKSEGFLAKKAWPRITIITVVYNGAAYLEDAISSVISQSSGHLEYVVIDGGSQDGSVDIIRQYEDQIDIWISEPDDGIYDAMNKGIRLATGDVIGILNSDDVLNDKVIEQIAEVFRNEPLLDFVYGFVERITTSGKVYDIAPSLSISEMEKKKFHQIPIPHGALFVKKNMFDELGFYKTDYVVNSDYDFILRLIENQKIGKKLDVAISRFRDGGLSSNYITFWERRKILKEYNVPFMKREYVILKAIIKLFLSKLLPETIVSYLRKNRTV